MSPVYTVGEGQGEGKYPGKQQGAKNFLICLLLVLAYFFRAL